MSILLTASVLLLLLWPAYAVLLHYSDRYALNRFLLLLAMLAVIALQFVSFESPAPVLTESVQGSIEYVEQTVYQAPVPAMLPQEMTVDLDVENRLAETAVPTVQTTAQTHPITVVYLGGAALMLLLLLGRMLALLALHLRSRQEKNKDYRLLHKGASLGQAFTFGANIYFSEDVPENQDFEHILNHERVHARQLHTVDILLTEVFLCVFWFHPAAWWLRTQMRANLEYLVDKTVVNQGADRRNYQLALVRQSVVAQGLALALPFSEPSLKSRIARLTGLPGYRAIGIFAAVVLTFWMCVVTVVIKGDSGADAGAREYLTAMAGPGDPYYPHYNLAFSEPVTSIEIYTNRMVTGDEYLQLRALLGQVPGAKLYAFKQAHDNGYSLEMRIGNNEPATITHLKPAGTQKWMYMLGVETGGVGNPIPVAMNLEMEKKFSDGDAGGMIRYLTSTQSNSKLNFFELTPNEVKDELLVLVNRKPISLKTTRETLDEKSTARSAQAVINGVNVFDVTADEWPSVVMEGRPVPTPRERLTSILGKGSTANKLEVHRTNVRTNGTYRQWFEDLELPVGDNLDEIGMARRYNDRYARLDFLLDTDFGPNSMIQVGYRTDQPGGMILVQVIDDTPQSVIEVTLNNYRMHTLNIYLKRLPTPEEIEFIRPYFSNFPGYDLHLYQSCMDRPGSYTLHLGRADQTLTGYAGWEAGSIFSRPKKMKLTSFGKVGITPLIYGQTDGPEDWPAGAENHNVVLEVDGKWIAVPEREVPNYDEKKMDEPIAYESLRCKLGLVPSSGFFSGEWTQIFRATGPETLEYLENTLKAEGLADRSRRYFIGEEEVSRLEFNDFPETPGAYAQVGALKKEADSKVVLQIIE